MIGPQVTGAKKTKLEKIDNNTNESEKKTEKSHKICHPAPRKRNSTSDSESKQDLMSLLQAQSAKEKADQLHRDEIRELLGTPTAKGAKIKSIYFHDISLGTCFFKCHKIIVLYMGIVRTLQQHFKFIANFLILEVFNFRQTIFYNKNHHLNWIIDK